MVPIQMPMDARMVLAKMSFIYEKEGGDRIKITHDEDVIKLINYAVDSINKELKKYLDNFIAICSPSELREMAAQGANIYRGAVVPEDEAFPTMEVEKPTTVMYRGVAVPAPESQERAVAKPVEAEKPKPKKAKRVYRGRVIED